MCDHASTPQAVGYELHQKKKPERLNSNASVSSLSEAASDMSLSTSPGSDLPGQQPKDLSTVSTSPTREHSSSSPVAHQPFQGKKPLVRKKSSNPYLVNSEVGSPCDDHPHIMASHSYAAGESRLYKKEHDEKSYPMFYNHTPSPRANSYPLTSDCVDESEEEIDEDEDDSSNDEKQHELNGIDNHLENEGPNDLPSPKCQIGIENSQHQSYIEMFRPGLSPTTVTTTTPQFFQDENLHHSQQQHNHHNQYHNQQQQQLYRISTLYSRRYSSEPVNSFGNKMNGFRCNTNENELYSKGNKPAFNELQQRDMISMSAPPKSREVNSWGHFHKPSESHYKYRRSHYSSDSDGDDTSVNSKSQPKQINPILPVCESRLSHCIKSCPTQSKIAHQNNVQPTQTKGATEKQEWTQDGVKPQEFKERFLLMKKWFSECNDGQKNIVMKGLLSLCELPQLHLLSVHMSKELHQGCPSNCEDLITWLPTDLAIKVLSYLDPVSLCHAAQVCRVWRQLAEDQFLWCRFCCQTKWRLSKAAEHKQVISHMCPEGSIQWKNVFAERFRLRNNWLKGRCTVRTFEGHLQGISCVQFDDSRIVSGSSDKSIKVWNMRTNAPWSVQTLLGHHGTVRCLHLEGNRLVSGSCDKTIKVWDLSTRENWSSIACKVTMTGHTDTVRCLQADDDKVISGSYDKTLKIWDLKTGELRRTLRGHQASVLCVHFSETKIVSGSTDKTIKVWNYEGNCMMTLRGHQDAVTCLMFDSTRIVSGSLDHNLKFWDIHTGECLNTIDWKKAEGHTDVVRCLQADSWRVVSAADDKTIKVWNLATGERLVTLRNHTDGVTCLQFNDFIIVSGSYDKSVKLWDFSCC